MPLSNTSQYALRAVLYVAEHGTNDPVPVDAIAADLRVPRNYLSKTLHALAQAGVLTSGRGPRGGFRLARPASELKLGDVAGPFGEVGEGKCLLGRVTCGWKNPCSAHPRWEAISKAQQDFFRHTTIADLLGEIAEQPAMAPAHDIAPDERRVPTRGPAAGARAPGARRSARQGVGAAKKSAAKRSQPGKSLAKNALSKQSLAKQSLANKQSLAKKSLAKSSVPPKSATRTRGG